MKCEKCNEKEATVFYSCNINGQRSEKHLCAECAKAEGLDFEFSPMDMFNDSFREIFSSFLSPVGVRLPSFGSFGLPMGSIMGAAAPRRASAAPSPIPDDAGEDIRLRRERDALKSRLDRAVEEQNFEEAIVLRDKLKELDK